MPAPLVEEADKLSFPTIAVPYELPFVAITKAAFSHLAGWPYERLFALHLLSVELLLVWFPFGKLMHAFTIFAARGTTGMIFERRGASL